MVCLTTIGTQKDGGMERRTTRAGVLRCCWIKPVLSGHHAIQSATVLAVVNAAPVPWQRVVVTSGVDNGCARCRSKALT